MSDILERYQKLKTQADRINREVAKAEGTKEHLLADLKKQFQCSTLEEARALLKKLQRESAAAEDAFDTALDEFQEQWGKVLNET